MSPDILSPSAPEGSAQKNLHLKDTVGECDGVGPTPPLGAIYRASTRLPIASLGLFRAIRQQYPERERAAPTAKGIAMAIKHKNTWQLVLTQQLPSRSNPIRASMG